MLGTLKYEISYYDIYRRFNYIITLTEEYQ